MKTIYVGRLPIINVALLCLLFVPVYVIYVFRVLFQFIAEIFKYFEDALIDFFNKHKRPALCKTCDDDCRFYHDCELKELVLRRIQNKDEYEDKWKVFAKKFMRRRKINELKRKWEKFWKKFNEKKE